MTHTSAVVIATAAMAVAGLANVSTQSSAPTACSVGRIQAGAPKDTTVTAASIVEAADGLPRHCRVDGHVAVPGNAVSFGLALPENWNGKFYFQGVGGTGGTIGSLNTGLARGYASASTDTGHQSSDTTWGGNRAKEIDYGHRGTHVTTVAAKALSETYYGKPLAQAYFNGCSNGGRQALMEVQRYPADFTGIIAGDPATGTPMQVGRALVYQHMLASEANYLSIEKVELLSKATLAACDKSDGLEDGLVSDPTLCTFKPATLACAGPDRADCLTAGQLETVRRVYSPVKTPAGATYTTGFPMGHEGGSTGWRGWITGNVAPTKQADGSLAFGSEVPSGYRLSEQNMRFLLFDQDEPGFNWRLFRFEQDLPRLKTMTEVLSPLDPDLRPFKNRGGKLLLYHGWADPAISAYGTVDYYNQMAKTVGGQREADAFSRLYLVPGMHHCSGGPGPNTFDMLTLLESWVERNAAPAHVIASRAADGKVERTRPLCPHPQVARYSGQGDINAAASFRCQAP